MKMKKFIELTYLLLICLCICSCNQSNETLTPLDSTAINQTLGPDFVDSSSYTPNDVYSLPNVGYFKFVNVPGMIFYTDQSQGATLAYINKTTKNSFFFCFDPICTHTTCTADILHLTNHMIYCNGRLYSIRPEDELGGGGTTLCSVALDATDLKECYHSDGNEIYDLLAYENTILFTQNKTNGGRHLIAYDTNTGKSSILSEQFDLDVNYYFTVNDAVYYTFVGDTHLYKTEDLFKTSERLYDVAKMSSMNYGDSEHIYGSEYQANEDGVIEVKSIIRCSLETGEIETIYESTTDGLYFSGIDDTYCYFYHVIRTQTPYNRSDGTPITNGSGGILYRIPKEGGEPEIVLNNIQFNISYVAKYDDDLYVLGHKYYQRGEFGASKTFTGILIDGEIKEITPR